MKEALLGVRAEAAMMRSPSFSREGESSTITNSSFAVVMLEPQILEIESCLKGKCVPKACRQSCIESKAGCAGGGFECPFVLLAVPLEAGIDAMSGGMRRRVYSASSGAI